MKTVQFHSKQSVERITEPSNVISIGCPEGDALPTFGCGHKRILRLEFDDVQEYIDESYVMFDHRMAKKVVDFANACRDESIVVHCHAGISRSCAIALFLAEQSGYTLDLDNSISRNTDLHNKLVLWELNKYVKLWGNTPQVNIVKSIADRTE